MYFSEATYTLVTIRSGLLRTVYSCYFYCPLSLSECPGLDNILYSYPVFMINWAFPEYKLVKSLEQNLTS